MPELPEVEVVRRGLERGVVGRTLSTVDVLHPRAVRRHLAGADDFATRTRGRRILAACRRGKYLWLPLAAGVDPAEEALVAHLGMSGQLLVVPAGQEPQTHLRVRFSFTDGGADLRFVDQRTFGVLALVDLDAAAGLPAPLTHIGRDPLDPLFDDAAFAGRLRARRTGLKRALLDQTLASGIGNIYADEALWRARLHYARSTETIRRPETNRLLEAVRAVMSSALVEGGTSFDSLYVDVNGSSGYFERSLEVYGREGRPCSRCGSQVRRDTFMNRSSYYCPRCQPRPRRGHW